MNVLFVLSMIFILAMGIWSSYSDIRGHQVHNKGIALFAGAGLCLQILSGLTGQAFPIGMLVNDALALVVSFAFFAARIWAAGDAKLFVTMTLLIPYPMYGARGYEFFPAFYVLGLIFTAALVYVVLESMVLMIRDIRAGLGRSLVKSVLKLSRDTVVTWLIGYLLISSINGLLLRFGGSYTTDNIYLLLLLNILLATAVLMLLDSVTSKLALLILLFILRMVLFLFGVTFTPASLTTVLVVIGIYFIRFFTGRYNYRVVDTSNVRAGQILAQSAILFLLPSNVKGLPKWTDETTRCRLSAEEAEAVRRWEKSKYGQPTIVIVRHIPFAPFIFLGVLLFLGIRFYAGEI